MAASINQRDVKQGSLPPINRVDEGSVQGVSLKWGDGWEDGGVLDEFFVGREV
jgi:hypothetical protein